MVVIMGLPGFSRLQVFGTCGLFFIGEMVVFSVYYLMIHGAYPSYAVTDHVGPKDTPEPWAVLILVTGDFLLVTVIFFIMNYMKRGTFVLSSEYEKLLLVVYALWFVTVLITRKFKTGYRNYYYAMAQWTKAVVFMAATMALLIFGFRLFHYSRLQVFGFFVFLIVAESLLYLIYYTLGSKETNGDDIESVGEVKSVARQKDLPATIDLNELRALLTRPIRDRLREVFTDFPGVFDFIDQSLDLSDITVIETNIINSSEIYRRETVVERPFRLFINMKRINDARWLNRYFLDVYQTLLTDGFFIGRAHTISLYSKRFFDKYPKYFSHIFYGINFIFRRVFPKLPVTKKVYFAITRGKNRAISRAETLGRLCFCGFKIVAEKEIGNDFYFIAQKVKTSSVDENPSYGPLVRFNRVGVNGDNIVVYKFRTMHPYSEYLQDYVYEKYSLQRGGKFKDDFRITALGRFMRKTWIDELPMLYNWIRGELNIVGVRPLSYQYFSMYPKDLQELRKKVVPGLIPPFYADLPQTFEEICESERKYIEAYLERPLRTQWRYFRKAVWNIVFKGARSN
jgi:hypothetical protein